MKIKFEKNGAISVTKETGAKIVLKIRNTAPSHSFPRWTVIAVPSPETELVDQWLNPSIEIKKIATLSGGGSYGWIIHTEDEDTRCFINEVAKEAKKANFGWAWNNIQTW